MLSSPVRSSQELPGLLYILVVSCIQFMLKQMRHHFILAISLYAAITITSALNTVMAAAIAPKGENVVRIQSLKPDIQRLKISIKRWSKANVVFISIGALAAAGLVVTSLALNRKNDELASLQDSLSEHEKQETAQAQKESAEAQLALRKYIDDVSKRRGPRVLDIKKFVAALNGKPKATVEILFAPNDEEAYEFALEIARWLGPGVKGDGAGWNVKEPQPIPATGGLSHISPYAPPAIRFGAINGLTIAANKLWDIRDKDSPLGALMTAFMDSEFIPSGERISAFPDNLLIIIVGQKR
jgi:hypothetical protein